MTTGISCKFYEAKGEHLFAKYDRQRPGIMGRLLNLRRTEVFCYSCGQTPEEATDE